MVAGPSKSSPNALSGVHYEGTAVRNEDGTLKCKTEKFREGSPSILSPGLMSPSRLSAEKDEEMDFELDDFGKKFKESIYTLIKSVARKDKREELAEVFKTFWKILTSVMSLLLFHGNSSYVIQYFDTKVQELLKKAAKLHQTIKFPSLTTHKKPIVSEESAALKEDWYTFLRNMINHLSKTTKNKCKIEELEKDLREEIGVLRGLDAKSYSFDSRFSKELEKQENLDKMQQAAQALFNIDDPSLFESLLKNIWKTQEPYIKSLEEEIAEMKKQQEILREWK